MKTMHKTKILCSNILLIVFLGACSTKKQLTSSSTAVAVDTATQQTAFQSLKPKAYHYPYFTYKLNLQPTPQPKTITTQDLYEFAFEHLKDMLEGKDSVDFEKAIFITENVYYRNRIKYNDYLRVLDHHTKRINALIAANDKSASMDFKVYTNFRERGLSYTSLRYTESEKRELYRKALTNWAIFTYLTDTLSFSKKEHLPFAYQIDDPFGMDNWSNSQVLHLLGSIEKKGNCFALVALFKIFSNRLNSEAYICTAPQHIYLQHSDEKGDFYNLELATKTYPSDGTLMTLTFTHKEAIMSGISLRRLKNEKQNIVLCLVNLGKSYEHKFGTRDDDFMLKCAELALQHDSLNLNAMLLKQQVLEEKILKYASNNNITSIETLQANATFKQLETHTLHLYDKGYHQMPLYMQEIILSKLQQDNKPLVIKDRTPNPFTSIKVPAKNRRYSTLSGGLYEEVHVPKQFEEYGYFVLDTKNRKLVKLSENANKELLIDPVVFAWSVDPMAHERTSWTPYNAFRNNPIINIDPTGALDDWYENECGEIMWDNNVNSQADLNKDGSPKGNYLGKTLTFTFNSYIDANLWDGPNPPLLPSPTGDKLTSTITLTASENAAGALTDISAKRFVKPGNTPIGTPRLYFPDLGSDQNKFGFSNTTFQGDVLTGTTLNFEQHASVSVIEGAGLNMMGYDIVNVAQSLNFSYANNRLSLTAATDIFPSATLTMNGTQLFKYNQPSFMATHKRGSSYSDNGFGGAMTNDIIKRPTASFQLRFSK